MVTIASVCKKSAAFKAGLKSGDLLVSVNGNEINDVLDYRFYTVDSHLSLALIRDGKGLKVDIHKPEYDELGLEFESFLIDQKKSCRNGCIFCFIDQNPKGMRETVYFKDDDERLSFLHGNYVTMTNLKESDIDRIIKMHISPLNVSVHTMNGELRKTMMRNKNAGEVLRFLKRLSDNGIEINAQLVLCEGLNDGDELVYSMEQLYALETLNSVSAVPVGVTAHREGLYPLKPYSKSGAEAVIATVNAFGDKCLAERGSRIFFAADEFYLKAEQEIPEEEFYEDYPQLENGVGMLRSHYEEFKYELECFAEDLNGEKAEIERDVTLITGKAAEMHIKSLAEMLCKEFPRVKCSVEAIENRFFGPTVTVSGLVTGGDIINQLKGKSYGKELVIPCNMLRYERDLFLDGVSVEELEKALGVKVLIGEKEGGSLAEKILGRSLT